MAFPYPIPESKAMPTPYWVYVLYSPRARRFYIGISEDLQQRLDQHNTGRSYWTARYAPWECVFKTQCPDITQARKFENRLKRQKGGRGFYELTGLDPQRFRCEQGS